VTPPNHQPNWVWLLKTARGLIRQVNSEQTVIDHWTLGGGTALMLQINHRESHDVDIFLSDAQLLAFLDSQKHDFRFEIRPADYSGDGTSFQKLVFKDIGEIVEELRSYRDEVARTLITIDKLNPEFVNNAIDHLSIKDKYRSVATTALTRAKEILRTV